MKNTIIRLSLVLVLFALMTGDAMAGNFTTARIRYDRMKAATGTSIQVTIVPATVGTEGKIKLVFGSATVGAGQSATITSLPANAIALPGTLTTVGSGTSIVISGVTDLTVGTTYAFNLVGNSVGTSGVLNPGAGTAIDTVYALTSGDATIDFTRVASRYIADDQVVITANVPPTFTFVLSGNTDAFTTDLTSGTVSTTVGIGLSVSTNAAKGWTGWVKSANSALTSVTTGESIGTSGTINATPETCVTGTDCYVLSVGVTNGGGGASAAAEYAGNGTTTGGTLSAVYQVFASSPAKTNGDVIWFKALATMLATKAAGSDYSDTWTIVGAGNF